MSTPVPVPSPLPWIPGLADWDRADLELVIGNQRFPGAGLKPRRLVLNEATSGSARLEGNTLHLAVAPGDADWALALASAFARPDRPAAADPASCDLLKLAARVGASPTSVLIEGPTGTGKEGLARHVHQSSPRRNGPLVAVNCAALAEQMVEATLFGHERGAFTGAHAASPGLIRSADGGTLFLDEVAELPLTAQAKLLRVLQEREVLAVSVITQPVSQANGLRLADLGVSIQRDGSITVNTAQLANLPATRLGDAEALLRELSGAASPTRPNRLQSIAQLAVTAAEGLTRQRDRANQDLEKVQRAADVQRILLTRQFAAMDRAVAQSRATQVQLDQQIAFWTRRED